MKDRPEGIKLYHETLSHLDTIGKHLVGYSKKQNTIISNKIKDFLIDNVDMPDETGRTPHQGRNNNG